MKRGMELRDSTGRPITPGTRVRSGGEEGVVGRIEPEYGVLTIIVEVRAGKSEKMVRASTVEVTGEPAGSAPGP
jgi:hypothetical protein